MQIDNNKVFNYEKDVIANLNKRELAFLADMLIRRIAILSNNPLRERATKSYMKILHGKNFYYEDLQK